jgi:hypothetical protein
MISLYHIIQWLWAMVDGMGNMHMAISFKLVIFNGYYNLNFDMNFDGNYKLKIVDEDT